VLNEMSGKFSRHALEHCESLGRRLSFARVKLAPLRRPPYRSVDAAAGRSRRIVPSVAPIQKVETGPEAGSAAFAYELAR
jgi:hypothetical protein